jgi:hypothetical protein
LKYFDLTVSTGDYCLVKDIIVAADYSNCAMYWISPLQLMTNFSLILEEGMKAKRAYRLPRPRRPAPAPKKQDHTLEFIQAVLDGREASHSMRQIGRRFGHSSNYISYHYPQEAALVATQYRAYRTEQARQRLE